MIPLLREQWGNNSLFYSLVLFSASVCFLGWTIRMKQQAGRLFAHTTYNQSLGGFKSRIFLRSDASRLCFGVHLLGFFLSRRGETKSGWTELARPLLNYFDDLISLLLMVGTGYSQSLLDSDTVVWTPSVMALGCLATSRELKRTKEGSHIVINARLRRVLRG